MNADRAVTNAVFVVVTWASFMLSLAEGRIFPVPLSLPIIFVAWIAKRNGRLVCPNWLAAVLGLTAFGGAIIEFSIGDIESRLLSIAHVVVYLTWIMLFLPWRTREYWTVLALSLLQIAVGAVLTNEGWYGGMLVVGLALILWAMSIFCYRNAHAEYGQIAMVQGAIGRQASASVFQQTGKTSGASQIDSGVTWLGSRFRRTLLKTLFATLLLASGVFAMVPRMFVGNPIADVALEAGRREAVKLTGYSDTVRLGEMGTILESNQGVLQVRVFDNQTDEEISVDDFARRLGMDEPLFRGTVMSTYRNGRWEKAESDSYLAIPQRVPSERASFRQEISLQRTRAKLMFAMTPYGSVKIPGERLETRAGRETGAIHYPRGRQYASRYVVTTPADLRYRFRAWPGRSRRWCDQVNRIMYQMVPAELSQLKALAATVGGTQEGLRPRDEAQAKRINDYLSDAERFTYSLTTVRMDESLDPVEDFLVNHRTGNCEFFATAMTLMLRAQKIPARVVNGFKGGHTSQIDGTFEVQQRHAHTWVEAYIDNRWETFDPTPPSRDLNVATTSSGMRSMIDLRMWLNGLWSRFVLNVSLEKQKQRVYTPMRNQFRAFADAVSGKGEDGWKAAVSAKTWFTVPGLVVAIVVFGLIAVPFRTVLWRWLRRLLTFGDKKNRSQNDHPIVRFYERFRSICKSHGLERQQHQTEREFVSSIGSQWNERLLSAGLSGFPEALVEQFYRVRFGDSGDVDGSAIESKLTQLESALAAD